MLSKRSCLTASVFFVLACGVKRQEIPREPRSAPVLDFQAAVGDPDATETRDMAVASASEIQRFFGASFPDPIHFQMVSSRGAFDRAVAKFGVGTTECWMVGLGTADLMVLLSRSAWSTQACDHDPNDLPAVRRLIAHELIHVYHGQLNPSRDFSGIEDLDWFVEGLAVFGSGQLTDDRLEAMQAAIVAGQFPASLSKVWTGPNRYGFAGSIARYVDLTWGRAMTVRLLKVRSTKEALALLGTTEPSLLQAWRAFLNAPGAGSAAHGRNVVLAARTTTPSQVAVTAEQSASRHASTR
jgi:hypothetical protein